MTSFGSPTVPKRVLNKRYSALPQGMPQLGSWLARRGGHSGVPPSVFRVILEIDVGERLTVGVRATKMRLGLPARAAFY